jgi:2-iminobutanoate/2-iminopropanoate deaminase
MLLEELKPTNVWQTEGNYAHAISVPASARQLFISGQIPTLEDGSVPVSFEEQCNAVWSNIGNILKSAGLSYSNLAKVTTYLASSDFSELNGEIRRKFLGQHRPALTVIVVSTLDPKWLLEIEAIAIG